ncbi:hypothetical protein SESBI_27883 [Sesbania bispinosa]|nr:hypothetical protein SESBI_27883 [Sesbania bispinosa]
MLSTDQKSEIDSSVNRSSFEVKQALASKTVNEERESDASTKTELPWMKIEESFRA